MLQVNFSQDFDYTGTVQEIQLNSGKYKLECWGAQGGNYAATNNGGMGGYSTGIFESAADNTKLCVCVGGNGTWATTERVAGGYNGGGYTRASSSKYGAGSGGGATHIATVNRGELWNYAHNQNEVLIVAGGGGGGDYGNGGSLVGGYGGGLSGGNGKTQQYTAATGGNQTGGGTNGAVSTNNSNVTEASFGQGAGGDGSGNTWYGGGGGGGYYGGGYGAVHSSGGGGSGYVSTVLSDVQTVGGTNFSSPSGSIETGHCGNGYARISTVNTEWMSQAILTVNGSVTLQPGAYKFEYWNNLLKTYDCGYWTLSGPNNATIQIDLDLGTYKNNNVDITLLYELNVVDQNDISYISCPISSDICVRVTEVDLSDDNNLKYNSLQEFLTETKAALNLSGNIDPKLLARYADSSSCSGTGSSEYNVKKIIENICNAISNRLISDQTTRPTLKPRLWLKLAKASGQQFTLNTSKHRIENNKCVHCKSDSATCAHKLVTVYGTTATCTADGLSDGIKCGNCGTWTIKQVVLSKLGHNTVTDNAVAATCTTAGKTAGSHCTRCGATIQAQTSIPALGHNEVSNNDAISATCTSVGYTTSTRCSRCGITMKSRTQVAKLEHTPVSANNKQWATCTESGKEADTICSVCGTTISTGATIPATGHRFAPGMGYDEIYHYDYCYDCYTQFNKNTHSYGSWAYENYINDDGESVRGRVRCCTVCGQAEYYNRDKFDYGGIPDEDVPL